ADADAFIAVFWARRGGAAAREDQEARWKYADEKFSAGKVKGSMSDRGKILSLFGVPTRVLRAGVQGGSTITAPPTAPGRNITDTDQSEGGADSKNAAQQVWVYEGDLSQKLFSLPKVELRFMDRFNTGEFKMETPRIDFAAARDRVIAAMIVRPEIQTVADINKPKPAPLLVPPPPVAPEVKTAAYATAVTEAKGGKSALSK